MLKLRKKFIKNVLLNGNITTTEKLYKCLVKQLLKNSLKSYLKLFQLFVSHLSYLVKFNIKAKYLNYKSLFLLSCKISFSLKSLKSQIMFRNQFNLQENINNLLSIKKQLYYKIFDFKKLLLFYRW